MFSFLSGPPIAAVTLNPAVDQTINVPNFAVNQVNRVTATRRDPGGKGVNVASILADRGLPVAVTGFLGRENAAIFEELFRRKAILDRFVRIAGATRTGIKIIDDVQGTTTDINFPGRTPTSGDVDALLTETVELATQCDWFVMAGSLPAGAPPALYYDLITQVRTAGGRIVLDTSGPALAKALPAGPTLVKPNIHEMEALCGRTLGNRAAVVDEAQRWRAQYDIQIVVVSLGAEGAVLVAEGAALYARPPAVTVASTVGAGDAMVSGLVAGLHDGLSLAESLRQATAFAAGAVTFIGSGLPAPEALAELTNQVQMEEM